MSQFFISGGQSIGASASASVFPVYIQGWEIPFRIDWFDLPAVQGTLKSLIQPNSKASFLQHSAFFDPSGGLDSKASACNVETRVRFLGREDPLGQEMAIHSSTLAWKIPWTEEPG